ALGQLFAGLGPISGRAGLDLILLRWFYRHTTSRRSAFTNTIMARPPRWCPWANPSARYRLPAVQREYGQPPRNPGLSWPPRGLLSARQSRLRPAWRRCADTPWD